MSCSSWSGKPAGSCTAVTASKTRRLELAYRAVQAGAAGVDMGRNVFQSAKPLAMMKAISAVVHQGLSAKDAFQLYNDEK